MSKFKISLKVCNAGKCNIFIMSTGNDFRQRQTTKSVCTSFIIPKHFKQVCLKQSMHNMMTGKERGREGEGEGGRWRKREKKGGREGEGER